MLGVAAFALFLSTLTDSSLGATLGALAFLIASSLLLTLDAAAVLRPTCPPATGWPSWTSSATRSCGGTWSAGLLLQGVYVAVFLGAAWANFTTKDITS